MEDCCIEHLSQLLFPFNLDAIHEEAKDSAGDRLWFVDRTGGSAFIASSKSADSGCWDRGVLVGKTGC